MDINTVVNYIYDAPIVYSFASTICNGRDAELSHIVRGVNDALAGMIYSYYNSSSLPVIWLVNWTGEFFLTPHGFNKVYSRVGDIKKMSTTIFYLANDHQWGFKTRNTHMVHNANSIRF